MDRTSKVLFILLLCSLTAVDSCLKQQDPAGPNTGPNNMPPTTTPDSHTLTCTASEDNSIKCMNGGTCYVTVISSQRITHCKCPSDYEGTQCQSQSSPVFRSSQFGEYDVPAIVGIVAGIIVLLVLIAAITFLLIRKRRKDSRPKLEPSLYPTYQEYPQKRAPSSNYAISRSMVSQSPADRSVINPGFIPDDYPTTTTSTTTTYNNNYTTKSKNNKIKTSHKTGNHPTPFTISDGSSTRKSGLTITDDTDHASNSSSRPTSAAGSLHYTSGLTSLHVPPTAYKETTL